MVRNDASYKAYLAEKERENGLTPNDNTQSVNENSSQLSTGFSGSSSYINDGFGTSDITQNNPQQSLNQPEENPYQNLIDRHYNDMADIEKSVDYIYLDPPYNMTIGRGHNINNPKTRNSVNFYVNDDGIHRPPTQEEKQTCFNALTDWRNTNKPFAQEHNYQAKFFKNKFAKECPLRITPEEEKRLYLQHVNLELPRIPEIVPNFNQLSNNKKLLVMDMVYNLGHEGFKTKFPRFIEATKANNTTNMLNEYHRSNVQKKRNIWARELLEEDLRNHR